MTAHLRVGPVTPRRRRAITFATGALVAGGGATAALKVFFALRNPYQVQIFPECAWHSLTGWQCPACGATRALCSFVNGDISASLAMNPLIIISVIAVGLMLLQHVAELIGSRRFAWAQWIALSILLASAVYSGVIRNLQ